MKKRLLLLSFIAFGELISANVFAQDIDDNSHSITNAVTLNHKGSFEIEMAPDYAFPLFTGPGEELWVPNWKAKILHGDGFEKGTVFQTSNHHNITTWLVLEFDRKEHHARYMRMQPHYDVGTVDVFLTSNGNGGSIVTVEYQLTGLGPERNLSLSQWDKAAYDLEMNIWRDLIISSKDKIEKHFSQ